MFQGASQKCYKTWHQLGKCLVKEIGYKDGDKGEIKAWRSLGKEFHIGSRLLKAWLPMVQWLKRTLYRGQSYQSSDSEVTEIGRHKATRGLKTRRRILKWDTDGLGTPIFNEHKRRWVNGTKRGYRQQCFGWAQVYGHGIIGSLPGEHWKCQV